MENAIRIPTRQTYIIRTIANCTFAKVLTSSALSRAVNSRRATRHHEWRLKMHPRVRSAECVRCDRRWIGAIAARARGTCMTCVTRQLKACRSASALHRDAHVLLMLVGLVGNPNIWRAFLYDHCVVDVMTMEDGERT